VLSSLFRIVLPDVCCLCDDRGMPGLDLCAACFASMPHNTHCCYQCAVPLTARSTQTNHQRCGRCLSGSSAIKHAIIPFLYRPPVDFMIKRLKFSEQTKFSRTSGALLANAVAQQTGGQLPDAILPVPTHRQRLVTRGYNQAEMIARTTARCLQVPIYHRVLQRSTQRLSQSGLSAKQREANIKRSFLVADKNKVKGLQIAVVDDVYTTGATARAIANHLHAAGVASVSVWAVARTP